jgi:hypothetical protein
MGLSSTVSKDRKIYGNWKVYSPEGYLMFRCDEKKANWYLQRKLAFYHNIEELEIKLSFNPKGFGNHNKEYGLDPMNNICVNCGSEEFLTRHHIIPNCYRKYFPLEIKSHNFHDVLPMCANCHERYEYFAFEFKKEIADKYKSPINGERIDNKDILKIKKKVLFLKNNNVFPNIPKYRIIDIRNEVKDFFGWKRLTDKRINKVINIDLNPMIRTHGEMVVDKITDIGTFIKDWRTHFIKYNECKYLPKNWSIDYE